MNALIVEDEKLVAQELVAKIRLVAPDIEVLGVCASLRTASRWLEEHSEPDLFFMDIQLSDGTSFELFNRFQLQAPVVFTTAYDEYAIRAFKVNGVDYLLKPVDTTELRHAIDKCRKMRFADPTLDAAPPDVQRLIRMLSQARPAYKEQFLVKYRTQLIPVKTGEIAYFQRDTLLYLVAFDGTRYALDYDTLDEVEDLLDPGQFYRVNRQFIVNLAAVGSLKPGMLSKMTLRLKEPLRVEMELSREKAPAFRRWLDR